MKRIADEGEPVVVVPPIVEPVAVSIALRPVEPNIADALFVLEGNMRNTT